MKSIERQNKAPVRHGDGESTCGASSRIKTDELRIPLNHRYTVTTGTAAFCSCSSARKNK